MTEHARGQTDLSPIAREDGTLAILAMDQRNTLARMLEAEGKPSDGETMRAFKVEVTEALSPAASAVLLDPDYGVPAVEGAGARAAGCGLLVAAEPAERDSFNGEPRPRRDPARNAVYVRALGGDAVKFLVQFRPDRRRAPGEPDLAEEVLETVAAVVADCRAGRIPSVVESLLYPLPGEEPLTPRKREDLIVASAEALGATEPDLLKLEYPGGSRGCERIAAAVSVPWAVLSAGAPFEAFERVVKDACEHGGACGFIAGRAFWKEAVALEEPARRAFLQETARARLEQAVALLEGRARPWSAVGGSPSATRR